MFWSIIGVITSLGLASAAIVNLLFAVKTNKQVKAYIWAAVATIAMAALTIALGLAIYIQIMLTMGKHT